VALQGLANSPFISKERSGPPAVSTVIRPAGWGAGNPLARAPAPAAAWAAAVPAAGAACTVNPASAFHQAGGAAQAAPPMVAGMSWNSRSREQPRRPAAAHATMKRAAAGDETTPGPPTSPKRSSGQAIHQRPGARRASWVIERQTKMILDQPASPPNLGITGGFDRPLLRLKDPPVQVQCSRRNVFLAELHAPCRRQFGGGEGRMRVAEFFAIEPYRHPPAICRRPRRRWRKAPSSAQQGKASWGLTAASETPARVAPLP